MIPCRDNGVFSLEGVKYSQTQRSKQERIAKKNWNGSLRECEKLKKTFRINEAYFSQRRIPPIRTRREPIAKCSYNIIFVFVCFLFFGAWGFNWLYRYFNSTPFLVIFTYRIDQIKQCIQWPWLYSSMLNCLRASVLIYYHSQGRHGPILIFIAQPWLFFFSYWFHWCILAKQRGG